MKKLIPLILSGALLLGTAACGGGTSTTPEGSTPPAEGGSEASDVKIGILIPGSLFKGMVGKDIPTVTECNELTVRADLDEDTVYKLTKAFIENLDDIRKGCATWADCTPEKAAKDTGAPMHPGAVRYYKEAGLLK